MDDWIVAGIVIFLVAAAALAIWKAKKSGKKCIGCPDAPTCGSGACSGCCGSCSCGK